MTPETTPSLGVVLGLPAAGLAVLLGLVAIGAGVRYAAEVGRLKKERVRDGILLRSARETRTFLLAAGAGVVIAALVGTGWLMWPWSWEYHEWRPVSGTVAEVNSRFIAQSKATEQKFVVRFEGSDQEYGCEDTRCSLIEPGDSVTLTCKRAWQYAGVDGYDCNFVSSKDGGS